MDDLTDGSDLTSDTYDCVICIQTLLVIYDVKAAIKTIHRILKPGGTALVTVPGISQICRPYELAPADYFSTGIDPEKGTHRLVAKLQTLGHTVTLEAADYEHTPQSTRLRRVASPCPVTFDPRTSLNRPGFPGGFTS